MKAYEAQFDGKKVILEEYSFGTYTLYYERINDNLMKRDDLYDTLEEAKRFSEEDYNIPQNIWVELHDHLSIMGPGIT